MQYCWTTATVGCKMEANFVTKASQLVFFAERHISVLKGIAACARKTSNIDKLSVGKSVGNTPSGKYK